MEVNQILMKNVAPAGVIDGPSEGDFLILLSEDDHKAYYRIESMRTLDEGILYDVLKGSSLAFGQYQAMFGCLKFLIKKTDENEYMEASFFRKF